MRYDTFVGIHSWKMAVGGNKWHRSKLLFLNVSLDFFLHHIWALNVCVWEKTERKYFLTSNPLKAHNAEYNGVKHCYCSHPDTPFATLNEENYFGKFMIVPRGVLLFCIGLTLTQSFVVTFRVKKAFKKAVYICLRMKYLKLKNRYLKTLIKKSSFCGQKSYKVYLMLLKNQSTLLTLSKPSLVKLK